MEWFPTLWRPLRFCWKTLVRNSCAHTEMFHRATKNVIWSISFRFLDNKQMDHWWPWSALGQPSEAFAGKDFPFLGRFYINSRSKRTDSTNLHNCPPSPSPLSNITPSGKYSSSSSRSRSALVIIQQVQKNCPAQPSLQAFRWHCGHINYLMKPCTFLKSYHISNSGNHEFIGCTHAQVFQKP